MLILIKTKLLTILNIFLNFILGSSIAIGLIFSTLQFLKTSRSYLILYSAFLIVLFNFIIWFTSSRLILPNLLAYIVKVRTLLLIGSVVTGCWLVIAIPLRFSTTSQWRWLVFVCDTITLAYFIFAVCVWFFTRPLKHIEQAQISSWVWILYALPMILVWVLYLLAFWPGSLSSDSIDQWNQMISFKFTDWHPAFHTLTNWLITRVWLSPAAIALTQIIAMSFVLGWGLAEQRRFGAPKWLPWMATIVIVLIPSNGLMVITLWKDVFYSISVIALTILVFKITMSYGVWLQQHSAGWVYLGITAALVALFRQNGPPVAFGTILCLLIAYQKIWKRFLLALVLAIGLWMGVRGPVYDWVGVDRSSTMARVPGFGMTVAHLIARYTNTSTIFLPNERALLLKIRPEQTWPYECQLETNLFFTNLDWVNLKKYTYDLELLTIKLIYRHPKVFVDHIICNSSFLYQITQSPDSLFEPMELGVYPNKFGIVRKTKLPTFKNAIENLTDQTNQLYNWIFWRVPFWAYLFLGSVTLYSFQSKNIRVLLVVTPIMFNMLPLSVMTVLQSFRYVYSTLIISVLMSGYFIFLSTQAKPDNFQNPRL